MKQKTAAKKSWVDRMLTGIEAVCNKLPPPPILFCCLFVIVAIIGAIFSFAGVSMTNPATGEAVVSANLFSTEGLHWFLDNMVTNFTGFAPLGLVIAMTLAIGICEESGMLVSLLNSSMKNVPVALVPFAVAFIGTLGNIASDTSMIIVPPLAALLYLSVGKHPVVGMIVGYAGAQAGTAANLMIAGTDSLIQSLTNQAIAGFMPDSTFQVDVTCNWFFFMASVLLCTVVIGLVSIKIIEPRFGTYTGDSSEKMQEVGPQEKKALRATGIAAVLYILIIVVLFVAGPLANEDGGLIGSYLLKGLIPILFVFFFVCGLTYGYVSGKFKNVVDVNKAMTRQMSAMGSYVLFCFFCGQFQSLFNWTKLGTMLAISGADFLGRINFTGIPLWVTFIILCAFINIFMASGSAKWAIFAPIFVPMFMLLGYHPGFAQLLYRIGDSPFNCFTPMSAYIWMLLSVAQTKYMKDLKIGTLVANEIPIAIVLQIAWIIFMVIWVLIGLPIGPGVGTMLPAGVM